MRYLVAICALVAPVALADAPGPTTIALGDNERVLHLMGTPFTHSYAAPRLETMLRQYYGHRGLVYRRVTGTMADFSSKLPARLSAYNPTLVVLQSSNNDLYVQWRRKVFNFSRFPRVLESVVKRLRAEKIRVIVCSPTPVGKESYEAEPQYKRLKEWVDAGRAIAARHGAAFVDLYTKAVGWPMIGSRKRARHYYNVGHHRKSWELFLSQVRFEPPVSHVRLDVKTGRCQADGAAASEVKINGGVVSLVLQNAAGAGKMLLHVTGLPPGDHRVAVDGKAAAPRSAKALAEGVDLGEHLKSQVGTAAYKQALAKGHSLAGSIDAIANYRPPGWAKVKDLAGQKQAAIGKVLAEAAEHEAAVQAMVRPKPVRIAISAKTPAGKP